VHLYEGPSPAPPLTEPQESELGESIWMLW